MYLLEHGNTKVGSNADVAKPDQKPPTLPFPNPKKKSLNLPLISNSYFMTESLYYLTTCLVVGVTSILGLCFLFLKIPDIPVLHNYKNARKIMAAAYITLSVLYVVELAMHSEAVDMQKSQTIKLTVAAFQAMLFTYTLISLVNLHFVTKRKILLELLPV